MIYPKFVVGLIADDTTLGSNEINISCVIQEKDALKAMTILHTKLFLFQNDDDE
jgi:hypothetical protein